MADQAMKEGAEHRCVLVGGAAIVLFDSARALSDSCGGDLEQRIARAKALDGGESRGGVQRGKQGEVCLFDGPVRAGGLQGIAEGLGGWFGLRDAMIIIVMMACGGPVFGAIEALF